MTISETTPTGLLDGLLQAMKAELEGHHFYSMAAKNTTDPKGREVFQILAADELEHLEFLKAQHRSLQQQGSVDASLSLGPLPEFSKASPIFSDSLKERIETAHYEMVAISVGAQLELNAIQFYQQAAEASSDPVVREFYQKLAHWEQRHYEVLVSQQEALKEDYWAAAGFAPF